MSETATRIAKRPRSHKGTSFALTPEQVKYCRTSGKSLRQLAQQLCVSRRTIARARRGYHYNV